MNLLLYIIAIIIVMLILGGFAVLAVFLRPAAQPDQQPKEKEQTLDEALGTEDPLSTDRPPRRNPLDIFRKGERIVG